MINCIKIRHQLHARPELSNQEVWTSEFVIAQLKKIGVSKIHTGFAQYSVLAEIDGLTTGKTMIFQMS